MENRQTEQTCDTNKPLYQLSNLIAVLERQEAERKAKEKQQMLAAAALWAFGQ